MVVKLQSHTSGSGKLVHKTLYGIQNSLRHFLTGNAHFQINFRMNTLSAETKMKVSKNFLPTMTKVIIAIVCSINFVLLLFNLSHILSKQFWAAIGPYIIMLFQNAFVFNDVFTKNDVSILIWLFSYTFLKTVSAAFLLNGKYPYFLSVASNKIIILWNSNICLTLFNLGKHISKLTFELTLRQLKQKWRFQRISFQCWLKSSLPQVDFEL